MYNKPTFSSIIFFLAFFNFADLFQTETLAIPYFARKYKTSCTTCHEAITKRNPSGEAFRRNGYIIPLKDAHIIKEKPVKLGAEEWKEIWPEAVWPGLLPESFPLAAYSMMRFNYDFQEQNKGNRVEFIMPVFFNLIFGGTFGEDVSFFGEWTAFAGGVNARGLQRLFLQFNDVVGPENIFNIRVGRFEPGITDGYVSSQRMTSAAPITIDYDPTGEWAAQNPQSGIELNGIVNHRLYYAAGVVNGESKTIADQGDQKDFYGRLAYMFGGDGYSGADIYENGNIKSSENFIALGLNSYWGSRNNIPLNGTTYNNYFRRYSFDINFHAMNFDLYGGFISGSDDNPDNDFQALNSSAYFLETSYNFFPWFMGLLRFEKAAAWKSNEDRENFINIIPAIIMLYRANIRFSIESLINLDGDREVAGNIISAANDDPFKFIAFNLMFAF